MSQLLDQAKEIIANEAAQDEAAKLAARDFVVQVAVRELKGETNEDDVRDLVAALEESGMSEADYSELLEAIPKAAKVEASIQHLQELNTGTQEARKELLRAKLECEARIKIAERKRDRCDTGYQLITDKTRKQGIYKRFPFLFSDEGDHHTAKPIELVPEVIDGEITRLRQADQERFDRMEEEAKRSVHNALYRKGHVSSPYKSPGESDAETADVEAPKVKASPKARKAKASELPSID